MALAVSVVGAVMCPFVAIGAAVWAGLVKRDLRTAGASDTRAATAAQIVGWTFGILGIVVGFWIYFYIPLPGPGTSIVPTPTVIRP